MNTLWDFTYKVEVGGSSHLEGFQLTIIFDVEFTTYLYMMITYLSVHVACRMAYNLTRDVFYHEIWTIKRIVLFKYPASQH